MSFTQRLAGKAIIIFGAGTGIGAATTRRLATEGARVYAADINLEATEALVADLTAQGLEAFAGAVDIADQGAVDACVTDALARLGALDGAHINAADMQTLLADSDVLTEDLGIFDRTLAVNLRGHLLCTRAVLPHLLANGGGAMAYTSSGAAVAGERERPAYAASKSGLEALMRHVASRWGREGVMANCVAPGLVMTSEMQTSGRLPEGFEKTMLAGTPHYRLGTADDIAAVVAMLLSEDGRWINGQVYHVNGGAIMR